MPEPSALYDQIYEWLVSVRAGAERCAMVDEPQISGRHQRDALAIKARRAARYLTALADRLELYDA
jgi:hypothetical protein